MGSFPQKLEVLHGQLTRLSQAGRSGITIQRLGSNLRVDLLQPHQRKTFIRFSPVVFFIVSPTSDASLVQVELLTYNEQVFQMATFGFEAVEQIHTFMVSGLQ